MNQQGMLECWNDEWAMHLCSCFFFSKVNVPTSCTIFLIHFKNCSYSIFGNKKEHKKPQKMKKSFVGARIRPLHHVNHPCGQKFAGVIACSLIEMIILLSLASSKKEELLLHLLSLKINSKNGFSEY